MMENVDIVANDYEYYQGCHSEVQIFFVSTESKLCVLLSKKWTAVQNNWDFWKVAWKSVSLPGKLVPKSVLYNKKVALKNVISIIMYKRKIEAVLHEWKKRDGLDINPLLTLPFYMAFLLREV